MPHRSPGDGGGAKGLGKLSRRHRLTDSRLTHIHGLQNHGDCHVIPDRHLGFSLGEGCTYMF